MTYAIYILLIMLLVSCIQPVSLQEVTGNQVLVVEGLVTDQYTKQEVKISRAVPLQTKDTIISETDATVVINVNDSQRITLIEEESGIYRTPEAFAGTVGEVYQLTFTLSNGETYESDKVVLQDTPEIDSIYATFTPNPILNKDGGDFNFYVDARTNNTGTRFLRWTWRAASSLKMATPSRYEWLGGNDVRVRELGGDNSELQVEQCWINQQSTQILVEEEPAEGLGFRSVPVYGFHSDSKAMRIGFGVELKQYGLSEESFRYWNLIAQTNQGSGFLFDTQVGPVPGNIRNTSNSSELVLGIFEASAEKRVYRQFEPLEFWKEGYQRTTGFYIDCFDIQPLETTTEEVGEFMERNYPGWEIGFFITGGPVVYFPRRCSNCTVYGTNQRPDFWL